MVSAAEQSPLEFSKMHGAGNDFVVLDLRTTREPVPALCRALADRHTGVGCDLILGVAPPRTQDAVASYRIWTPDGSPSMQCGNGARCIAAWVMRAGMSRRPKFDLDSPSGTHAVEVLPDGMFRVSMGVPQFAPQRIPLFGFERQQDVYEAEVAGLHLRFAATSIGNPHALIEVADIQTAPVARVGRAVQRSPYFHPSVNVGFAQIVSPDRVALRVYEYGAGETLACGSGACAAAAILMRQGRIRRNVSIGLPGGDLQIAWEHDNAQITMSGPATFVFDGILCSETIAGARDGQHEGPHPNSIESLIPSD